MGDILGKMAQGQGAVGVVPGILQNVLAGSDYRTQDAQTRIAHMLITGGLAAAGQPAAAVGARSQFGAEGDANQKLISSPEFQAKSPAEQESIASQYGIRLPRDKSGNFIFPPTDATKQAAFEKGNIEAGLADLASGQHTPLSAPLIDMINQGKDLPLYLESHGIAVPTRFAGQQVQSGVDSMRASDIEPTAYSRGPKGVTITGKAPREFVPTAPSGMPPAPGAVSNGAEGSFQPFSDASLATIYDHADNPSNPATPPVAHQVAAQAPPGSILTTKNGVPGYYKPSAEDIDNAEKARRQVDTAVKTKVASEAATEVDSAAQSAHTLAALRKYFIASHDDPKDVVEAGTYLIGQHVAAWPWAAAFASNGPTTSDEALTQEPSTDGGYRQRIENLQVYDTLLQAEGHPLFRALGGNRYSVQGVNSLVEVLKNPALPKAAGLKIFKGLTEIMGQRAKGALQVNKDWPDIVKNFASGFEADASPPTPERPISRPVPAGGANLKERLRAAIDAQRSKE